MHIARYDAKLKIDYMAFCSLNCIASGRDKLKWKWRIVIFSVNFDYFTISQYKAQKNRKKM